MIADDTYQRLCKDVMRGAFSPGERISIRRVAAEFGVSLTPVREAVHRLTATGALQARPNASPEIPRLSGEELRGLSKLRQLIEGEIVYVATNKMSARDLAELKRKAVLVEVARANNDKANDLSHVQSFYFDLYAIADWSIALEMAASLWLRTGPYMNYLHNGFIQRITRRKTTDRPRARLLAALENRDALLAKKAMVDDIETSLEWIASEIEAPKPRGAR